MVFLPYCAIYRHYKYKVGQTASVCQQNIRTASDLSTIQFRLIFKGHKSLEYWYLVIHLTSVSTISYAESNGGIFSLIDRFHLTSRRPYWCTKTMKWRPYWCTVRESTCFTGSHLRHAPQTPAPARPCSGMVT